MKNDWIKLWIMGGLNHSEWLELGALEYVLTWNYTDDMERDEKRYRELSDRKWAFREQLKSRINY